MKVYNSKKKLKLVVVCLFLLILPLVATSPKENLIRDIKYIALGDSISTGYGLENIDDSYARITTWNVKENCLSEIDNINMNNLAINGLDSNELLIKLENGEIDIPKNTDFITLSIGANDLLGPFQRILSDFFECNKSELGSSLLKEIVTDPINVMDILSKLNSEEGLINNEILRKAAEDFSSNLEKIIHYIKKDSADTRIYVMNIYNPYKDFNVNYFIDELRLGDISEEYIQIINEAFNENSEEYKLIDVYSAFNNSEVSLVNANSDTFNFDPHPNKEGHAVIAKLFSEAIENNLFIN